ncbi:hypothetical protein P7C70_g6470, partial [Phenoliferia sp. Uapishka_3]
MAKTSHPSGLFLQGDASQLGGITRKARNRPEKTGIRRNSTGSVQSKSSTEGEYLESAIPQWQTVEHRQVVGLGDRHPYLPPESTTAPFPSVRQMMDDADEPPGQGRYESHSHSQAWDPLQRPQGHYRRVSDFDAYSTASKRVDVPDLSRSPPRRSLPIIRPIHQHDPEYRTGAYHPSEERTRPDSTHQGIPSGLPMSYSDDPSFPSSYPPNTYRSPQASSHHPSQSPTASSYTSYPEPRHSHQNQLPPFNPQVSYGEQVRTGPPHFADSRDYPQDRRQSHPHAYSHPSQDFPPLMAELSVGWAPAPPRQAQGDRDIFRRLLARGERGEERESEHEDVNWR